VYFVCFPVSESDGYNFICHLPGELHGGRDALSTTLTLTDPVKKKHLISVILEVLEYQ